MAPVERVIASGAVQHVVADAAEDHVVARAALEDVVSGTALKHVVSGAAEDDVTFRVARNDVVAGPAPHVPEVAHAGGSRRFAPTPFVGDQEVDGNAGGVCDVVQPAVAERSAVNGALDRGAVFEDDRVGPAAEDNVFDVAHAADHARTGRDGEGSVRVNRADQVVAVRAKVEQVGGFVVLLRRIEPGSAGIARLAAILRPAVNGAAERGAVLKDELVDARPADNVLDAGDVAERVRAADHGDSAVRVERDRQVDGDLGEVERIVTFTGVLHDGIAAPPVAEPVDVVPGAARQHVVPPAAFQDVAAGVPGQGVVVRGADGAVDVAYPGCPRRRTRSGVRQVQDDGACVP